MYIIYEARTVEGTKIALGRQAGDVQLGALPWPLLCPFSFLPPQSPFDYGLSMAWHICLSKLRA